MLPVEVRILPTYQVVSDLHMLDTYAGLTVPLIASATATFLFRQFFLTIPDELAEAARIDGAGPMRFFIDVVVPLSRTNIAALFVILFIYGWNQYLWPLLVTTQEDMYTSVIGIKRMLGGGDQATDWNLVMATAMLAMLPPALVVILMQKWFVNPGRQLPRPDAANAAIDAATGDYLIVLDDDDLLEPDHCERTLAVARAHPHAIPFAGASVVDAKGELQMIWPAMGFGRLELH